MSYWTRNEWIEDAKDRVLRNTKRADNYARELIFLYDEAAFNIEKEIEALFARFAKDNGLTEDCLLYTSLQHALLPDCIQFPVKLRGGAAEVMREVGPSEEFHVDGSQLSTQALWPRRGMSQMCIRDRDECRGDIKQIKADYITKEDFFREQAKTDRKLDRIMDILLEMKGDKKSE